MPPSPGHPAPPQQSSSVDTGLRCPVCEYNLTGLSEPRCPECGQLFDWDELRRAASGAPVISFERARGWRKVTAFVVTWATVLFAPWVFARQAVQRVSVGRALIFGGICFLPVTARYALEGFDASYFAWVSAAAIYIVLQAALFILLDPTGWRRPLSTFAFWLAIGGYTTAIVVTECFYVAPLLSAGDLWDRLWEFLTGQLSISQVYGLVDAEPKWVGWLQLAVWLVGLAGCYVARLRKRHPPLALLVPLTLLCVMLLLGLYAFCVDPIATTLWHVYGGGFPF